MAQFTLLSTHTLREDSKASTLLGWFPTLLCWSLWKNTVKIQNENSPITQFTKEKSRKNPRRPITYSWEPARIENFRKGYSCSPKELWPLQIWWNMGWHNNNSSSRTTLAFWRPTITILLTFLPRKITLIMNFCTIEKKIGSFGTIWIC